MVRAARVLCRILARLFICLGLVYIVVIASLYMSQESLMFPGRSNVFVEPAVWQSNLGWRAEQIATEDGLILRFWALPAAKGYPTILSFHGNGSSVFDMAPHMVPLHAPGYGLVLAEFRGYGGNPGKPTEAALIQDSLRYYDWVTAHSEGLPVVFGESIGTGVAVALAAQRPACGLILDSAFTSIDDVVHGGALFFAPSFLLSTHFANLERIGQVKAPILFLAGSADRVIPSSHSHTLADASRSDHTLLELPGVPHLVLDNDVGNQAYTATLGFLGRIASSCSMP